MAATQLEIDTLVARIGGLNQAIADGVRQVTLGDQTITYNTTDSLIRARDDVQAQLGRAQRSFAGTRRPNQTYLYFTGRGY